MAKPRKTPTFKQKQFAKAYVENKGNASKAALTAYNVNKAGAKTLGYQQLQKPIVQKEIKDQLDKAGLSLEVLNEYSLDAISNNLKYGKASQAAGISQLQFLYKLHNALPASKKLTMNLSLKDQVVGKDFDEIKKLLEKQAEVTTALLAEIKG